MIEADRAGTEVEMAKGGYYPSMAMPGEPQESDFGEITHDLIASQMPYDQGRVTSKVDSISATQRKLSKAMLVACDDVALDIVETYLDVLTSERRVEAVRKHIQRLDGIREMTQARGGGGYAGRDELDRANLELLRAQEQLSLEKGNLQDACNQYAILISQELADLVEPEPMSLQRYLAASDMARVIRESPLQCKALEDANVAGAGAREAKASLLSQLNLGANAPRRKIGGHPGSDSVVFLRLRMNTLQGLSNSRRPAAAQQCLESAKWSVNTVRRDVRRQLQNFFNNGNTLRWREQSLAQQVTESEQAGELYREQFEVGRRDVIDLFNVQRKWFEVERQPIDLRIECKHIEYRVAAQVGLLSPLLENRLNHGS